MNIIKYLYDKNSCPECHHDLVKDTKSHEIYCSHCGFLVLDDYPITDEMIDFGLSFETSTEIDDDLKYIGTMDGIRRYL